MIGSKPLSERASDEAPSATLILLFLRPMLPAMTVFVASLKRIVVASWKMLLMNCVPSASMSLMLSALPMMLFSWKMLSWHRPESTTSGASVPRYVLVLYLGRGDDSKQAVEVARTKC